MSLAEADNDRSIVIRKKKSNDAVRLAIVTLNISTNNNRYKLIN